MKTCVRCGTAKDESDFPAHHRTRDGLSNICGTCKRAAYDHIRRKPGAKRKTIQKWRWSEKGRSSELLTVAKSNAKRCGVACTLSRARVARALQTGVCEMSGLAFVLSPGVGTARHPRSPSLDRVNPSLGYTDDNVRVVCWQVNLARNEYGDEALYEMVEALHKMRTISSQAPRGEGSTTRAGARKAKRPEVHATVLRKQRL